MSLALDNPNLIENGPAATGTLTRTGDLSQALSVAIANSDTTEASAPASVIIPAGSATATGSGGARVLTPADFGGSYVDTEFKGVAVLSDGRVVAGGTVWRSANQINGEFAAARFNADGTPDTAFATGGIYIEPAASAYGGTTRVLLQTDGRIVVAAAPGVLANDSDVERSPLTAVLVAGPANGPVALNADGSFTYTPRADYFGTGRMVPARVYSPGRVAPRGRRHIRVDLPAACSILLVTRYRSSRPS